MARGAALVSAVALGISGWIFACTDDGPSAATDVEALPDGSAPDAPAAPSDSGGSDGGTKRDCANDVDPDGIWKHLECSGLYASFADKQVASDVRPYKPAFELWSDGAEKQRWVFLPAGSKIDISDWNDWSYPVGTKLWKEFKLGGKRIETRLFTKLPDQSWAHTVYRWNADESDAVRKDGGESIAGLGPDGGPYEVPSSGQCDQCHMGRKDQVLGFEAVSLGLPNATGQTLARLVEEGWLSQAPPATTFDLPGSAEAKAAIGWASINCGACHNANTNAAATFRKHMLVHASELLPADGGTPPAVEQLDFYKQTYCVDAFRTDPDAGAPYKYIRGGSPASSMMSILAGRRTAPDVLPNPGVQMPPIVSRAVDQQGVAAFNAWVATLPACP